MSDLDLNINNYNNNDIEKFFKLNNKKYTESDVELREYEIREQLISSGAVNARFKKDLIVVNYGLCSIFSTKRKV